MLRQYVLAGTAAASADGGGRPGRGHRAVRRDARPRVRSRLPSPHRRPASGPPLPEGSRMGPLNGVRVIEIASLAPAPFGCMVLADLGADVLRVDRAESCGPGATAPPDPLG